MVDSFYRAFEDKFRGSSELIKSRLQVYLPFIKPLLGLYPKGRALDLGCGRGEWLELLNEQGFDATGVDLDDGMLQACRKKGFQVQNADAVTYMKAQLANSFCIVSGFHIVEHLPFEVLKQFVAEARRLLLPGGVLILETPNPENISVGSNSFYLDPTHERPIPPGLLSFLPEYYDFQRYKVLRLQGSAELFGELSPKLIQVIAGVSPDYAVVAQTQGSPLLSEALNSVFEQEYGLTLHTLAERYQASIEKRLILIEHNIEKSRTQEQQTQFELQRVSAQVDHIGIELMATQNELETLHEANHQNWQLAQEKIQEINALRNSKSWRITAPLRWSMHQLRLISHYRFKGYIQSPVKKLLSRVLPFVATRPKLKALAIRVAYRLGVAERLKLFVRNSFYMNPAAPSSIDSVLIGEITNSALQIRKSQLQYGVNANQRTPLESSLEKSLGH
jgi:SAM-dependent methyltransferase